MFILLFVCVHAWNIFIYGWLVHRDALQVNLRALRASPLLRASPSSCLVELGEPLGFIAQG